MPFDRDYFERFYGGESRVYGPDQIDQVCRGMSGFIEFVGAPLGTVLDAGAGTGMVRDWFRARGKQVRSVDVSEYACATYGHEQRDLASWREAVQFDLIVCFGVLAYLGDEECGRAIDNLAAMSSGFLYLNVTTNEDVFFGTVGEANSDLDGMQLRPKAFYLERLDPHWLPVGLGLFYRRTAPLRLQSLERCG